MGYFDKYYTDSDGETHNVKDIPDFGRRGGDRGGRTVPGDVAAVDARKAKKKYAAELKAEQERLAKMAEARRKKAEQDRKKAEAKAQAKARKQAAKDARKNKR